MTESDSSALALPRRLAQTLARHRAELEALGVERLDLFGSAARGEQGPGSDLDFVVRFRGQPTFARYMDLKALLEDLFACPVDLATWKSVRPDIRERVQAEAIRVA